MDLRDLVVLERCFEGVVFSERDHSYFIDGEKAKCSVTQAIKRYEEEFKEKKIANIVAKKQGVLVEDILNLWEFKREYACLKGTMFHLYVENFLQRKKTPLNKFLINSFIEKYKDYVSEQDFYNDMSRYVFNFLDFYRKWKEDYILIKPELVIADKETLLCGCIDNLSYNHKTGELAIFDYKSNKEIKNKSKDHMKGLLSHLESNTLVKYSLQIHLYKLIFERNTPYKIKKMEVVWVGGSSLEVFPSLDLEAEAQTILNDLKNH
jgi:ATP-dependent exoDNAse (exonuclease V) beta subunit